MNSDEIVQPIVLVEDKDLTHEIAVLRAAELSVNAYLSWKQTAKTYPSLVSYTRWQDWLDGRFTKTVRRLKHNQAYKLDETGYAAWIGDGDVSITTLGVAYPPMLYAEFPDIVKKAQVQGVDYPRTGNIYPFRSLQIVINPNVEMTTGKTAAQAAHALMSYVLRHDEDAKPGTVLAGLRYDEDYDLLDCIIEIHDAGLTEVPAGTSTAKVVRYGT